MSHKKSNLKHNLSQPNKLETTISLKKKTPPPNADVVAVEEFPLFDQPVEVKAIHAQRVVESGGELYEAGGDRPF